MTLRVQHVTFDCTRADTLAGFWSEALGRTIDAGAAPHFASIGMASDDQEPALLFQAVPEAKTVKNRMHVDLHGSDREPEVLRLIALGATRVAEKDEWGTRWTVMQDPEGNEFCVA
jgi:hypothetical protein